MPLIFFSLSPMKISIYGIFLQFDGNNRLYFLTIVNWVILRSFISVKFGKKSHFKSCYMVKLNYEGSLLN